MNHTAVSILFLIFSIYFLIRVISYGIYEIKNENNNFGGYSIICISIIALIFSNIMILIN